MENIDKSYDKEGFHKGTNVGPILSDTYCRFKFPLKYPDRVLIGSTILTGGLQITTIVPIFIYLFLSPLPGRIFLASHTTQPNYSLNQ